MYSLDDNTVWELPPEKRSKLQKITEFKSKSGHRLSIKQLHSSEHAKFINDNWKFKDKNSLNWIRKQCKNGFAYGVFKVSDEEKGMVIKGREC